METDIYNLIEWSSWNVTCESSGYSTMSSGLVSFSKARSVASTEDDNGQDFELDDHDFCEEDVGIVAPHESIGEDGMKVIF